MKLNPYIYGADNMRDIAKILRLHSTGNEDDRRKAEEITRQALERWNSRD